MTGLVGIVLGLLGTSVLVSFCSPFVVRLIVRIYPANSARRDEFVSELDHVPLARRVPWLAGILATAIVEGMPDRLQFVGRDFTVARRTAIERSSPSTSDASDFYSDDWVLYAALGVTIGGVGGAVGGTVGQWVCFAGAACISLPMMPSLAMRGVAACRWIVGVLRGLRSLGAGRRELIRDLLKTIDG